ncbi:hypothetical protein [Paraburkholderia sp. BL10I2N1]|uniref:hypothetical protein n=1 Tax=Paraburkholderia sp. BL10I2N1 TaxID=1938796 RepID=UPI00105F41B2|nr:hypothetical protein [Paraburkholderia sp. BL10I2N1]TDN69559.1 hypothetical protein B0G77_2959 [Paraburkholderia sp. BL10I2N1]
MKKTILMYWPLAVILPLAAAAYIHACSEAASRASQAPLAAGQLTAELARTVSYGLVDDNAGAATKNMRATASLPAPPTF